MSGSRGVLVRKAVTDGLAAYLKTLPAFNGHESLEGKVRVGYAYDFTTREAQQVYTGRSRATTEPTNIHARATTRDERGSFDLHVRAVVIGAESAYDSDLRAFEIGEAVDDWLAARKSGGGLVDGVTELTSRSWESDYAGVDGGAGTILTKRVHWRARLT